MAMILLLVVTFFLQGALGEVICEELPIEMCSFSTSWSGNRCVLETYDSTAENVKFQCKTSEVFAENVADWVENDDCIKACGLDRKSVGISSDALLEPRIIAKLCSTACFDNCPNIVDLYYNLALAEGAYLPDLCEAQRRMPRREMSQLLSSGAAASSPIASYSAASLDASESDTVEPVVWAPAPTPF